MRNSKNRTQNLKTDALKEDTVKEDTVKTDALTEDALTEEMTKPKIGKRMYYSIKDVSALLDEPESTLRYWQDEFPEAINPSRSHRGVRYYKESDIDDVRLIKYFIRDCGLTLEGVRKKLKNNKESAVKQAKVVMKLKKIKARLIALSDAIDEVAKMN